jgi:hypothetical protein
MKNIYGAVGATSFLVYSGEMARYQSNILTLQCPDCLVSMRPAELVCKATPGITRFEKCTNATYTLFCPNCDQPVCLYHVTPGHCYASLLAHDTVNRHLIGDYDYSEPSDMDKIIYA